MKRLKIPGFIAMAILVVQSWNCTWEWTASNMTIYPEPSVFRWLSSLSFQPITFWCSNSVYRVLCFPYHPPGSNAPVMSENPLICAITAWLKIFSGDHSFLRCFFNTFSRCYWGTLEWFPCIICACKPISLIFNLHILPCLIFQLSCLWRIHRLLVCFLHRWMNSYLYAWPDFHLSHPGAPLSLSSAHLMVVRLLCPALLAFTYHPSVLLRSYPLLTTPKTDLR